MATDRVRQRPAPLQWRRILLGGAVAGAIALFFLLVNLATIQLPPPGVDAGGYVRRYHPPQSAFEAELDLGDGQAYAVFAQDPTITLGKDCCIQVGFLAPLLSRPVFVYLVWATSLGQPSLLPVTFSALQVLSAAALGALAVALVQARGRNQRDLQALFVVLLPGALTSLHWYGPELLATDLALAGLICWIRDKWVAAAMLFVLAALTRELTIVFPAMIVLHEVWFHRRHVQWRHLLPLTAAPIAYVLWSLFIHARLALPASDSTGLLEAPWNTIGHLAPQWGAFDFFMAVAALVLVIACIVRRPRDLCTWIVAGFGGLALTLDTTVWAGVEGFSRVLLPLYVLGIVVLMPVQRRASWVAAPAPM